MLWPSHLCKLCIIWPAMLFLPFRRSSSESSAMKLSIKQFGFRRCKHLVWNGRFNFTLCNLNIILLHTIPVSIHIIYQFISCCAHSSATFRSISQIHQNFPGKNRFLFERLISCSTGGSCYENGTMKFIELQVGCSSFGNGEPVSVITSTPYKPIKPQIYHHKTTLNPIPRCSGCMVLFTYMKGEKWWNMNKGKWM